MTQSFFDGCPVGSWAIPARSPEGVYGVMIGCGDQRIGFVPEEQVATFLAAALQHDGDDDLMILLIAAYQCLPQFKLDLEARVARRRAASSN